MATATVSWPALTFGPVNLLSLPPAWFFYMTPQEKMELFHQIVMTIADASIVVNELKGKSFITRVNGKDGPQRITVEEVDDSFAADVAERLAQSGCNVTADMVKAAIEACMTRS